MTTTDLHRCEPGRPPGVPGGPGLGDSGRHPVPPAARAEPGRQLTTYYAVRLDPGRRWDPAKGTREQALWDEHARHVDALFEQGAVVLAGPFSDRTGSMVIVRARDARHALGMFLDDPWSVHDVLVVGEVKAWTIFLDGRDRRSDPAAHTSTPGDPT